MKSTIAIIIPAFNEENRIITTLTAIKEASPLYRIYVVDDGSTDATAQKVAKLEDICLIKSIKNKGKGEALKIGIETAIATSDILVFLDADLQESAKEVKKLIGPILNNEADVTVAKFPPAKKKGGFGLVKKLAQYGVYINTGKRLTTVLSGQRAFKKEVLQDLQFNYSGYGVELGMTIDILNKGYLIKEVAVNMFHNETGRDLQGFYHRGKQFFQILKVFMKKTK
ncbi:glycosyltransferase family 2 protein [Clostridium formicaceticum]|uniref:Glucosyl-3-phosphoglycerate synthase n=1 Tax=Clostridium formicaceticum TaxID=1497 RepID=A0AAC9RIB4_9CLOT|nr:glycosyltransferase family 2 protein [Clostridium formicaceticum]AOY77082.1 glycosyl transferase [Clostridium formicaceticum]ARE87591.1 Glucosyl-3-phosphoglycerate synthase [Clostridium formicaceticum]